MPKILIVDDEEDIRELIAINLMRENYQTIHAADGLAALELARTEKPDLILLDLMLPEKNGVTVFNELREDSRTQKIPVLMLTALGKQNEKIDGLELGADDYVTKPFSPKELVLRVRNLLRRTLSVGDNTVVEVGPFRLDKNNLKLHVTDEEVDLTSTEFKLLHMLIESPGVTKDRAELLKKVWGYSDMIQTRTLDTHIKRLREKLGSAGRHIETVRGVGYRYQETPVPT